MGELPKKALRESQLLIPKPKDEAAVSDEKIKPIDGSHQTCKASFIENNKTIEGFYKKLSPDKDYPELLAKMSVATSFFKRLFQGKRSAEERLVFDENNKLTGTFSINVEGFRPFSFVKESIPADEKEKAIPSTKTLIEHNFIEVLFGRWVFDDDDGHPHNMSLAGDIDFDMFWYWFTIWIKKPRTMIGVPKEGINLTTSDWAQFPVVKDSKPYHWPTYTHPGQETIPTDIPGQGQIYSRGLPKAYPEPGQFENLASSPVAQEQKFAAALKMLLTFQPEMVRKCLYDLFGDMTLNYASLDETSVELRVKYEKKFPHLCNEKTNTESFIDFMMKMYQEHYDNIYRVVVFYMGCENNGYGVPLPSTCNALYQKPSYYRNIEAWVSERNKEEDSLKYDLSDLQKRYHQVWRDAFAPYLKDLLHDSYHLTRKVLIQVSSEKAVAKLEAKEQLGKETTDTSLTSAWELFSKVPDLTKEKVEPLILVDKENKYREALFLLMEFTRKFNAAAKTYYEKERQDLTEEDNLQFSRQLGELYSDYNLQIREQIRQNLAHTSSFASEFNRIAASLKQFTEQANFKLHLTMNDEQMTEAAKKVLNMEIFPLDNVKVMKSFNKCLFQWVKKLKPEVLEKRIIEIIDNKYKKLWGAGYREAPVKEYLKNSAGQSGDTRLAYILSSSDNKDNGGSLNILLIKHLTTAMMNSRDIHLPSIQNAVKDKSFYKSSNLELYTKSAMAFASNDPQFVHLFSAKGKELLFQAMYEWVEAFPSSQFNALLKAALRAYEQGKSVFTRSRRSEVEEYHFPSQAKKVAFIFKGGEETSTLNDILFEKIINAMKTDLTKNPDKQQYPGCQLIMQYNHVEHKKVYDGLLKSYSTKYTHIQDTKQEARLAHV